MRTFLGKTNRSQESVQVARALEILDEFTSSQRIGG